MKTKKTKTGKPFISLERVTVDAHGRSLFKDLSWALLDDEHWAVLGPNASGKSTLMNVLAGSHAARGKLVYHFLQEGEAAHGQIAHVAFEDQRGVLGPEAYYQDRWNIGLNEEMPTVSDYLSERGVRYTNRFVIAKKEKRDTTFPSRRQKVIRQMGLKPLLGRKLFQLSNGERRKVSIARALLKNPKLLILDNPFEGLDVAFRATLKKNLESLMRGKMRVIIVGTGREEMPSGITHILRIRDDRTVVQGTRRAVLKGAPKAKRAKSAPQRARKAGTPRTVSAILVAMKNVNVSYNDIPVLKQLNWTVRENEKWALFGPNGVGKTTLLSLILGDNPQAYANDITLFGKRRGTGESIWDIKKNIGWVSPELQLYYPVGATCLDVVASGWFDTIGLYRQCTPRQQKTALSWLKRLGLAKEAETPFENVSEGEERLVLLARALVKSPKLLVLDEPVAGLDVGNRDRVLRAIDAIAKHPKMSMIYVTHRADELPKSITHTLKLEKPA